VLTEALEVAIAMQYADARALGGDRDGQICQR
jgi:hypothetical protein